MLIVRMLIVCYEAQVKKLGGVEEGVTLVRSVRRVDICDKSHGCSYATTMASPPLGKESSWRKAPRRVFNRVRDRISQNSRSLFPALPETSTANIPNDDPGVVRDRSYASSHHSSVLFGTDSADKVGETPDVDQQSSSHPETNTADKIKKAWGVTRSALMTALRLLEKSADAFPPLKSAVGGLVACLDLAQVSYGWAFNTL